MYSRFWWRFFNIMTAVKSIYFVYVNGDRENLLTTEFLIAISKLVAPPLDKVVRHGGVRGGCRSSQRFVARHALRSRTHPVHFKRAANPLIH